jgi:hypothetical protein
MKTISTIKYDILHLSSASICLLHCLLFPLLTFILITIEHVFIDAFFALIGVFVFFNILISKTQPKVKNILFIGNLLVITGILLHMFFKINTFSVIVVGIIMVSGHVINFNFNLL